MEQRGDPTSQRPGGRPTANVVAKNFGLRAKDGTAEQAGGLEMQTYNSKGTRCIATNPGLQEWWGCL